ncbi:MAG: lipocalin family protein, partial [Pseudomonadota bacterium]
GGDFAFDLRLATDRAPVLQGEAGFSLKSERGQASYYFTQPFFTAEGVLEIDGEEIAVTGNAWMDREFSSQPLDETQIGWDWFALRLGPETAVMAYRLRTRDGVDYMTGNWVENGVSTVIPPEALSLTPTGWTEIGERRVPTSWRVEVPGRGLALDVTPVNAESWMGTSFPYWEGPIRFTGTHAGVGYLEMTGY